MSTARQRAPRLRAEGPEGETGDLKRGPGPESGWPALALLRLGAMGQARMWGEADGRGKGNGARRLGSRQAPRPVAPRNFSARTPLRAKGRSGGGVLGPAAGFQFISSLEPFLVTIHC